MSGHYLSLYYSYVLISAYNLYLSGCFSTVQYGPTILFVTIKLDIKKLLAQRVQFAYLKWLKPGLNALYCMMTRLFWGSYGCAAFSSLKRHSLRFLPTFRVQW